MIQLRSLLLLPNRRLAPLLMTVLLFSSVCGAMPRIHSDATIRWPDLQYQAKPDGSLMYLDRKSVV